MIDNRIRRHRGLRARVTIMSSAEFKLSSSTEQRVDFGISRQKLMLHRCKSSFTKVHELFFVLRRETWQHQSPLWYRLFRWIDTGRKVPLQSSRRTAWLRYVSLVSKNFLRVKRRYLVAIQHHPIHHCFRRSSCRTTCLLGTSPVQPCKRNISNARPQTRRDTHHLILHAALTRRRRRVLVVRGLLTTSGLVRCQPARRCV